MTSVIIHSSFDIIDRMEAEVNRLETLVISAAGGQHGGLSAQMCVLPVSFPVDLLLWQ